MTDQQDTGSAKGLPVAGYRPTQPPEVIEATNLLKHAEERFYRMVEHNLAALGADPRDAALAKTYAQIAFSTAVRSLMKPQRIRLPEDDAEEALKGDTFGKIDMEASKGGTGEE